MNAPPVDDRAAWAAWHRRFLARVDEAGLWRSSGAGYALRAAVVTLIYGVGLAALCTAPSWGDRLLLLELVTFAAFQGGLIAHEIAHRNLSRSRARNRIFGQYFMSLLAGQAYAHWEWQHLTHHRHTQEKIDPDLDVDLFALTDEAAKDKRGFYRWTTRHQALLLWPLLTMQGFSIRGNTLRFVWKHRRRTALDAAFLAAHLLLWLALPAWFLGLPAAIVNYLLATWMIGPWLAGTFIWNHLGKRDFQQAAPAYAAQRVLGSRSLLARPHYTFFFGAINFHVEHHLAPHVPSAQLPKVRPLLKASLSELGLELPLQSYAGAIVEVHRHLRDVAKRMDAVTAEARAPETASSAPRPLGA